MKTKPVLVEACVELLTIKDKDSYFRAKRPTEYYVQIWLRNLCVREIVMTNRKDALAQYRRVRDTIKAQSKQKDPKHARRHQTAQVR